MADEELIVAGWVLVRVVDAPVSVGVSLPPHLLTISDCIQPDLPKPGPCLGDWFQDPAQAEQAAARLTPSPALLTVAMAPSDASTFVKEWEGETPWFERLHRAEALAPEAAVLGYEVVGAEEVLDFHSWHCHGYADDARRDLGISLNHLGLIATLQEARSVMRWMLGLPSDQAPKPVPWTVVALAGQRGPGALS
ncbi:hypothetical protein N802_04790 [Knoellia sinensis KCTC 19936]|uniref:Uncharacterized protein n=1 Tax=Knoellia sinensis KCTC 19936 TaxID=1385520 RepID=A0A0A0J387_9MICO|nr:hypothetical protein [Knoellia sinensis]KGN31154.1 hypothetical protein N802_04790 [Knoellia sinensis KCTC 19936]